MKFWNMLFLRLERRLKERSRYLVVLNVELGKKPEGSPDRELWDKLSISM